MEERMEQRRDRGEEVEERDREGNSGGRMEGEGR
jgi:hypothetical protein